MLVKRTLFKYNFNQSTYNAKTVVYARNIIASLL